MKTIAMAAVLLAACFPVVQSETHVVRANESPGRVVVLHNTEEDTTTAVATDIFATSTSGITLGVDVLGMIYSEGGPLPRESPVAVMLFYSSGSAKFDGCKKVTITADGDRIVLREIDQESRRRGDGVVMESVSGLMEWRDFRRVARSRRVRIRACHASMPLTDRQLSTLSELAVTISQMRAHYPAPGFGEAH